MTDVQSDEAATLIVPYEDGPLIVRGDFQIQSHDGTPIPAGRKTVALCRCGRSAIKPFCDGSHARTGFRSSAVRGRPVRGARAVDGEEGSQAGARPQAGREVAHGA
jgi:CDGSH-type Zn-finger protein